MEEGWYIGSDDYNTIQQMYLDKNDLASGNAEPKLLIEGEEYQIEWNRARNE